EGIIRSHGDQVSQKQCVPSAKRGKLLATVSLCHLVTLSPCHPSYRQSGSSGCFRSHSGRRLRTVGITAKLYVGGGEGVDHSSVQASQGSAPAGRPLRSDTMALYTKSAKLGTWIIAPSVVSWLSSVQPR